MTHITRRRFGGLAFGAAAAGSGLSRRMSPGDRGHHLGLRRSASQRQFRSGRSGDRRRRPAGDRGTHPAGSERRLHAQRAEPAVQADLLHLPDRRRRHDPRRLSRQRPRALPQPVRPDREPRGRAARRPRGLWRAACIRCRSIRRWCGQGESRARSRTAPSSACCAMAAICSRSARPRPATR